MFGKVKKAGILIPFIAVFALAFAIACQSDPEIVTVEKIVTQEVIKEVEVPGETVVVTEEVVKEVQVPGETVVVEKEVVKTVEVPGETVVVEKEVVKEVEVEKIVEVEKEVEVVKEVQLVVTPTAVIVVEAAISAPAVTGDVGIINIAITDVPPGVGLGSAQLTDAMHYWGVGEVTMKFVDPGVVAPMLAESWELDLDMGSPVGATLKIRDNAIFHGQGLGDRSNMGESWGPVRAQDVAFTINDGNGAVNTASIHWQAGDFATMFGNNEAIAADDRTLKLTFAVDAEGNTLYDPRWSAGLLNDAAQAFSVQSLNRYETVGETEMKDTPFIGTGPLHVVEWVQDDTAILEAVPYDHWDTNSKVDRIVFKEVGEQNTQIALMETGEVDAAPILLRSVPRMLEGGFAIQDNGLAGQASVSFSGNLWETEHVLFGTPLDTAAVYMRDLPWISNPNPDDGGACPAGCSDFEEGVLVRNALARAINREEINEFLMNGIGHPIYLNAFSPNNPNWQSKWEYEYDPMKASELLAQAGYPNGFEMPLYAPNPGGYQELADAIAGYWEEIGVRTAVQKYAYSVYRPTIVARPTPMPWVTERDAGKGTCPGARPRSGHSTL
ncbi:MAG: ABC transporter substrate-binding protein, partial [Dehalococcoidia bacterium]|nr:ABC transporter substrate-binding protein [Dehalococcoidia bacterium]